MHLRIGGGIFPEVLVVLVHGVVSETTTGIGACVTMIYDNFDALHKMKRDTEIALAFYCRYRNKMC